MRVGIPAHLPRVHPRRCRPGRTLRVHPDPAHHRVDDRARTVGRSHSGPRSPGINGTENPGSSSLRGRGTRRVGSGKPKAAPFAGVGLSAESRGRSDTPGPSSLQRPPVRGAPGETNTRSSYGNPAPRPALPPWKRPSAPDWLQARRQQQLFFFEPITVPLGRCLGDRGARPGVADQWTRTTSPRSRSPCVPQSWPMSNQEGRFWAVSGQ